jgi:hypothetical protein
MHPNAVQSHTTNPSSQIYGVRWPRPEIAQSERESWILSDRKRIHDISVNPHLFGSWVPQPPCIAISFSSFLVPFLNVRLLIHGLFHDSIHHSRNNCLYCHTSSPGLLSMMISCFGVQMRTSIYGGQTLWFTRDWHVRKHFCSRKLVTASVSLHNHKAHKAEMLKIQS